MRVYTKKLSKILEHLKKSGIDKNTFNDFEENFKKLKNIKPNEASEPNIVNTTNSFLQALGYGVTIQSFQEIKTDGCIIDKNDNTQVIIEYKKQTETKDFPTFNPDGSLNFQVKSFYQLIKYYLEHKIDNKHEEIKCLIITNGTKWFIIDIIDFKNFLTQNTKIEKYYKDNRNQITEGIYNEFSEILKTSTKSINIIYFDINENGKSKLKSEEVYLLLRKEFLLKEFDLTDSNTLNTGFYDELLHIIGIEEKQKGSKKTIKRLEETKREDASLLENTINRLNSSGKLANLDNITEFGIDKEEQLYNIALELTITWINRLLFLKLLEAQLVKYNAEEDLKKIKFLDIKKFKDYSDIYSLFFEILAVRQNDRIEDVKNNFNFIPYLNSSLFEPTDLEISTLNINSLKNNLLLSVPKNSVISEKQGKEYETLPYLLDFLDRYNISSSQDEVYLDNSSIINASVLGLIYEKLNGHKDGSYFTPGFITEYMCRETLRRAVVQKFNDMNVKAEGFDDFTSVYNYCLDIKPEEKVKLNQYINEITICDPAVGSGHFLVSALNEMIAIKSELKLLLVDDKNGKRLDCSATVKNDTLQLKQDNKLFIYDKNDEESSLIQKTIFHEKQNIIENSLFGVDINPNSVKICRLRLWIELLKNTYYKGAIGDKNRELEVLPNIDINIKCGNSLISKFDLKKDTFKARDMQIFREYKENVSKYKKTTDKDIKTDLKIKIEEAKTTFEGHWTDKSKSEKELEEFKNTLDKLESQFGITPKTPLEEMRILELERKIEDRQKKVDEEKNNPIYRNAFEWRFEFPEVLSDNGDFKGFDVVIGNPPYFSISSEKSLENIKDLYFNYISTGDIYALFVELSYRILKQKGYSCLIISNKWLRANYGERLRKFLIEFTNVTNLIDFGQNLIFDSAIVHTNIILFEKDSCSNEIHAFRFDDNFNFDIVNDLSLILKNKLFSIQVSYEPWSIIDKSIFNLKIKSETIGKKLFEWDININFGLKTGYNEAFILDKNQANLIISKDKKSKKIIKPILRGRDTRRYYCNYSDFYIINSHNGYKGKERIDVVNDFPEVYKYLLLHEEKAKKRKNQGKHWTNLRNCAYIEEFEKPKIVFSEIVSSPQFYYDEKGYYPEATVFFISGNNLKYLTALLNSKFVTFLFKSFYMGGELVGKIRYKKAFLLNVPIPQLNENEQQPIIDKVNQILKAKKTDPEANTSKLEEEIDQLVYKLYGLTDEEIIIVEGE